jgi:hypothetical protein
MPSRRVTKVRIIAPIAVDDIGHFSTPTMEHVQVAGRKLIGLGGVQQASPTREMQLVTDVPLEYRAADELRAVVRAREQRRSTSTPVSSSPRAWSSPTLRTRRALPRSASFAGYFWASANTRGLAVNYIVTSGKPGAGIAHKGLADSSLALGKG